jgi:hypothetical protein
MKKFTDWLKMFEKNKNENIQKNYFSSKDSEYIRNSVNAKNYIKKNLLSFNSN